MGSDNSGVLVLVHTIPLLVGVFENLAGRFLPGVRVLHILDEPLLEVIRQRGRLDESDVTRLCHHICMAEGAGARAVLVTCSTISPCVDEVRRQVHIHVEKIDEEMIAQAVRLGSRIGVLATSQTTLEPTRQLLLEQAAACEKRVEIRARFVEHALSNLLAGDGQAHDCLVMEAAASLADQVDVIVLAQATMARVLDSFPKDERKVPVLSSPEMALRKIVHLFSPGQARSDPAQPEGDL